MNRGAWSPAEDEILRKGIAEGWPITRLLAKLPGRSASGMENRSRKLSVVMRDAEGAMRSTAKPWTAEEDAQLLPLIRQNVNRKVIAREVKIPGRTAQAIDGRVRRLRDIHGVTLGPKLSRPKPAEPTQISRSPSFGRTAVDGSAQLLSRLADAYERYASRTGVDFVTAVAFLNGGPRAVERLAQHRVCA